MLPWDQSNEQEDKFEYAIVLALGANDFRLFLGHQDPGQVNPDPIHTFTSDRDMFSTLSGNGWRLITTVNYKYPYDDRLRFIWERRVRVPELKSVKI